MLYKPPVLERGGFFVFGAKRVCFDSLKLLNSQFDKKIAFFIKKNIDFIF
jgi:hypothetical protein